MTEPDPAPVDPPYFVNNDHALRAGFMLGVLLQTGYLVHLVTDDDGIYLNRMFVEVELVEGEPIQVPIEVVWLGLK
jgi:hypothetical protein